MLIGKNLDLSAEAKKLLANRCCICGTEFYGVGGNPAPYRTEGECCIKCFFDYVLPSREYILENDLLKHSKDEIEKEIQKFRHDYVPYSYNTNENLVLEIGEHIIKDICEEGIFNSACMKTDSIIEGKFVQVAAMTKEETIDCMQKYLSTIDKTLEGWLQETGYKLFWIDTMFAVASSEYMQKQGHPLDEPFIENDTDAIEQMAERPNVETTNNVAST
jgi:hypothetical protein